MAEENEKKPGFVVHKKQQDSAPASAPEKKRVLVVKKKAPAPQGNNQQQTQNQASANANGSQKPRVVVKKVDAPAPAKQEQKNVQQKTQQQSRQDSRPRTFELNSARPNVKAGNLSDKPRQGGYNRGGQGGGFNRGGNGQGGGRPYGREGGGFSGTQARQSYQNRERDGQNGGFNRGNGQGGGYNRGGNGQGGFNRGNGQNGGFNRGSGMGGQGGFRGPRPGMGSGAAAVPPVDQSRQPAKKAFKGKKQIYNRKDEEQYDDKFFEQKKKSDTPASVVPKEIDIMETISVSDLARKMNLKASEVIGKLMGMGMMVTITQSIDSDTATLLAAEYGCEVHLVSLYDETVIESEKDDGVELLPRPPIVTVMGHVDHGKTKTLDAIRHSHVAEGEAGGITQSIGAYSVKTPKGTITFLDTPGHEAFTMMRARGAQVTDIVVLVVAADDGVMPQTLEAISHAKDAKVPIIVAVNKVDKPEANPDRVKTQLSERGLTPEEWGGDTQYVHISALRKEGIDDLLDAILLQAEMLELKANNQCRAEGKILESRVDQGRGVVSTVIIQRGTLHQGDPFVAGIYSGRVRAMFDDRGKRIQEAGPSIPVEVLGIEEMPNAGDPFQVTESEKDARAISAKRQELKRFEEARAVKKVTLENFNESIKDSEMKELKVIIKADLQGSAEALKSSLEKLSTREIRLSVIHSSAGAINESDVTLAAADSNAIIIGFNVRPTPKAKVLADQERVEIRKYNIIYKCVEEIQAAMEGMLQPDTKEEVIGMVEVRDTFKVPKVGVIAGCSVSEGIVRRTASVNLVRDGIVIFTGKISSLKRFKDDVKEVSVGYECGIGLENWQDIQIGDRLEVFEIVEVAKKLGKTLAEEQAEIEKRNVTGDAAE
ncbi:MAG: translation initiation factor IF-2 [Treponema sp.]|nr:translation initiation factor IF-2 [Treponema sp.]